MATANRVDAPHSARSVTSEILDRLPVYAVLKRLVGGFSQAKRQGAFRPALLTTANGEREPAYIVEEHGDGQVTVLVPWAPTPFVGSIKLTSRDRVEELEADLASFTRVISHWGVIDRSYINRYRRNVARGPVIVVNSISE